MTPSFPKSKNKDLQAAWFIYYSLPDIFFSSSLDYYVLYLMTGLHTVTTIQCTQLEREISTTNPYTTIRFTWVALIENLLISLHNSYWCSVSNVYREDTPLHTPGVAYCPLQRVTLIYLVINTCTVFSYLEHLWCWWSTGIANVVLLIN